MGKQYIEERAEGLYVAGARVSLASVIFHFYGAIAHCLANPEAIDQYLKSQEQVWDELPPRRGPFTRSHRTAITGRTRMRRICVP